MGRTPEHVAGFFSGFAANPAFFAAAGQHYADNLVAFYEYARDNHLLFLTRSCRRRSIEASHPINNPTQRYALVWWRSVMAGSC
jgi:4-hydroxyphenylacetate 3-monooxygenase